MIIFSVVLKLEFIFKMGSEIRYLNEKKIKSGFLHSFLVFPLYTKMKKKVLKKVVNSSIK